MRITFSPGVGEVKSFRSPSPIVFIHFTATFADSSELKEYQARKASLQLWSDLPSAGSTPGEWSSFNLTLSGKDSSTLVFLSLPLAVPEDGPPKLYSFTYRLVYPSGEIEWLGSFGQNGLVQVVPSTLEVLHLLPDWRAEEGEWPCFSKTIEPPDTEVLNVPSPWTLLHFRGPSSFVALVPPPIEDAAPATLILTAGLPCLSVHGSTITCSASLPVVMRLQPICDDIIDGLPGHNLGIFNEHVFLGMFGVITAVPLFRLPVCSRQVHPDPGAILKPHIVPPTNKIVCLWNPSQSGFILDSTAAVEREPFLEIPATGIIFSVHTTHTLNGVKVFLPAQSSIAKAESMASSLPTPPPSPRLHSSGAAIESTTERSIGQHSEAASAASRSGGLLGLIKRLFQIALALITFTLGKLRPKRANSDRSNSPSERTPLIPESSRPPQTAAPRDNSQADSTIYANMPDSEFTLLVFPEGKETLIEYEGQSLKPDKTFSIKILPLGAADGLSYQLSKPGRIKIMVS